MERYRTHSDAAVYFLTWSVVEWLPVFIREAACSIITDRLAFCHREKHFCVNGFVIMPTQLHLIVLDREFDSDRLGRALTEIRKFTGRRLSDYCRDHRPGCFPTTLHANATADRKDRKRRFWRPSRHPVAIYRAAFWQEKLDYIHDNPCRSGLVCAAEHWRFSSAALYLSDGKQVVDVPITPIAW